MTSIVVKRPLPYINTRQLVWQPVTDNGDLAMRFAPIDWQPAGAHACIQMLSNDLHEALKELAEYRKAYLALPENKHLNLLKNNQGELE